MAVDVSDSVMVSKLDLLANWVRKNSLWPMPFATACCGIELMATGASKHDIARFGAEVMRFSPRQCDLMIVAGTVTLKMAPVLNGLAARRTRTWVGEHFANPPKLSPGSQMPAYKFNPQDLTAITDYLMAIPK